MVTTSAVKLRIAFAAVCLGNFIILLDTNIVNLALPHIRAYFGGSLSGMLWVANGYTLALAALILNGGALADRFGPDRAYRWGAAGFAAASLACGVAPTLAALIVFRVIQGVFGALLFPSLLGLLPHLFTDPARRARAVSAWASTGGVALAVGPVLGGVLIDRFSWHAIFLVNVPFCLAVHLGIKLTVSKVPQLPARLDLPGQALAIVGLGSLCFVLIEGRSFGWGSPVIVSVSVASVLAIIGFIAVERRSPSPLLPLSLFRNRAFTAAVSNGLIFQFVYFGSLFVFPYYLATAEGGSALSAGLKLLPLTVATAVQPLVTGRLIVAYGLRTPMLIGAALAIPGFLVILLYAPGSAYWLLGVAMVLQGCWSGLTFPPTASMVVASTPEGLAGTGSGVLNASRQLGAVLGVAVLGTIMDAAGSPTAGLHVTMLVSVGGVLAIVFLLLMVPHAAHRSLAGADH